MTALFLTLVNMSIAAGWLVLAVLVLRLLLRRAPKWIAVLLWGLVAVRLVCPFTIESALSLIPSAETVSPTIMTDDDPQIDTGLPIIDDAVNPLLGESVTTPAVDGSADTDEVGKADGDAGGVPVTPLEMWIPVLTAVWLGGVLVLSGYTAVSYWRLHRRVNTAVRLRDNVYQSERVESPFVLGIIRPRIYLPFGMNERDAAHVIAHEEAHIRRRDHWWKPLGFLLLTVYWFNPLMWLGYVLLCRDIELACDEKVIREMGTEQKADYSQALLTCSVSRRTIAACPLAFGEAGVKDRVRSVLHYKRPTLWIIILSVVALVVSSVCFLTDPEPPTPKERLLAVLDSKERFIDPQGRKVQFKNYLSGGMYATAAQWYTFIDCNADGVEEMVVRVTPVSNHYMVFGIDDGDIYSFEVSYDLSAIKQDGTFQYTEQGNNDILQYLKIRFGDKQFTVREDGYSSDVMSIYRIDRVDVSSQRMARYVAAYGDKPPAVWTHCYNGFSAALVERYRSFLEGSETAVDANGNILTVDAFMYDEELGDDYTYTYMDMTGDGVPELCINKQVEKHFFTLRDEELRHWHTATAAYTKLLNNGALLYERHGGGPEHVNYEYYELNANAQKRVSVEFSRWAAETFNGEEHPARYEFDGKEVTQSTYERKTKKYLNIGSDEVVWYDRYGYVMKSETALTDARDLLRGVLGSNTPFVAEDGEKHLLNEYVTADGTLFIPQQYTYVDFESDGTEELVAYGNTDGNLYNGVYMVFYDAGSAVWGFEKTHHEMMDLKQDGTFLHFDKGTTRYVSAYFSNRGMMVDELAYMDEIGNEYRIRGEASTERYVQEYLGEFYAKPDAIWLGRASTSNVATGEFYGGKVTMTYTVTDVPYPFDMRYIPTVNGYAHFFDRSEYTEFTYTDRWNALDKDGRPLFEEKYEELSYFSADGVAVAKKQSGEYVSVTTAGEETPITEEEFERLYKQWYSDQSSAGREVYPSARPDGAVSVSSLYNGALALYVAPSEDNTYLVGLMDSTGKVVIPAFIRVQFFEHTEHLDLHEGVAYVDDFLSNRMGKITVTVTPS